MLKIKENYIKNEQKDKKVKNFMLYYAKNKDKPKPVIIENGPKLTLFRRIFFCFVKNRNLNFMEKLYMKKLEEKGY